MGSSGDHVDVTTMSAEQVSSGLQQFMCATFKSPRLYLWIKYKLEVETHLMSLSTK